MPTPPRSALFVILGTLLAAVLSTGEARGLEEDYWIGKFEGDLKTGLHHVVRKKVTVKGTALIQTDVTKAIVYFQGGEKKVTQFVTVWEHPDGRIKGFTVSTTNADGKAWLEGTVGESKIKMFYKPPKGDPKEYEEDWDRDVIGPAAVERLKREKGFSQGQSYDYKTYSLEQYKVVRIKVSGRGRTPVWRRGKGVEELPTLRLENADAPRVYTWEARGKDGAFLCLSRSDGQLITQRLGREAAETRDKGTLALYPVAYHFRCPGTVIHPRFVESALVTMELSSPLTFEKIRFKGPGQRVQSGGGKSRSVTLALQVPRRSGVTAYPVTDEKFKGCLSPNYFLDFGVEDDPVGRKAKAVAGPGKDALRAARRLSAWIGENVHAFPLNCGFATASEVLARRGGDCTEQAVLLCAMARSLGIPARMAGGLALQGATFQFHAWAEVWAGDWVPLDPTNPGGGFDAMHLRFGAVDLNNQTPEFALYCAGSVAKGLTVAKVTYWLGKVRLVPGEVPGDSHTESGGGYTNTLYGMSLGKPAHWRFSSPGELRSITGGLVAIFGRRRQERVLIRPFPAEYHLAYDAILKTTEQNYWLGPRRRVTVDGREAVCVKTTMIGGGYNPLTCYVRAGDVIYAVESNDCSDDCRKAFELVLKTLRFRKWERKN
jgi:hypothetical protein